MDQLCQQLTNAELRRAAAAVFRRLVHRALEQSTGCCGLPASGLDYVYCGPWVTDAKKRFSKINCLAYPIGKDCLTGKLNRQEYLETAIRWMSKGNIEDYLGRRQNDPSAVSLWNCFQSVVNWVETFFIEYRSEMKGLNWGTP